MSVNGVVSRVGDLIECYITIDSKEIVVNLPLEKFNTLPKCGYCFKIDDDLEIRDRVPDLSKSTEIINEINKLIADIVDL